MSEFGKIQVGDRVIAVNDGRYYMYSTWDEFTVADVKVGRYTGKDVIVTVEGSEYFMENFKPVYRCRGNTLYRLDNQN